MSMGAGRRLTNAARAVPRAMREDLWTTAADPLPRMTRPRWLARLPHVLVAGFAALTFANMNGHLYGAGTDRSATIVVGVQAAALIVAMFRPVPAWWMATSALIVGTLVFGDPYPWGLSAVVPHAAVLFLLALRVRPRAVVETLLITTLASLACTKFEVHGSPDIGWAATVFYTELGRAVVVFAATAAFGAILRARRVARSQLLAQTEVAAEERTRRTVLEERGRIARELHDVVAHHLSVISIQAQVAPHLVDDPPEELKENLAGIRQNAKEALTELRRVLGVLRVEDARSEEARHAPQPTLDRLDDLVGNLRAAGVTVSTETTGEPRPLAPGVELSAFRLVQEALSNAIRHAPGATARVLIGYDPTSLTIRISNTAPARPAGPSPGAGHGLLGMRERVTMLGGILASGPTPDGGYEVFATLPAPTLQQPADYAEDTA
ncbi:sensor histidine kinase [Plantactinospora sp. S1510]|uniref:histidine kinase n=1 Tax=Plantactinospora alkalitolerans TaxID=2789879 RepID=A0ABS0GN81_9ACTN|nr:sensor histidine kinase [Plantactinospora alkalitolerans]MBF9127642.1 sensor histidine kinase [Plantactinospora alkalitolerans]